MSAETRGRITKVTWRGVLLPHTMQSPKIENQTMHGIAVAVLSEDREQTVVLQNRLESTNLVRVVYSHAGFPVGPTDPVLRQVQDQHAEVVLVDIDPQSPQRAISTIELIHSTTNDTAIFAVGEMSQPATIVAAMRAGAGEFLDRSAGRDALLEALTRFTTSRSRNRNVAGRARIFVVLNAKGGAGATTTAVNTAIALQEAASRVVLVDFAPIGHAALHLNLRPNFGVVDALQNLHRMDASLLDGLMTPFKNGLHLLAGMQQPLPAVPTAAELARLFDLLVSHYSYVVVDCGGRMEQTDVVSLWSAGRIQSFLQEGGSRDRVRLVLNRYKKIPGFSDEDVERATSCKVLWKVPNNFQLIGPAIDKGVPVALQETPDVSRSYQGLAAALADAATSSESSQDLVYDKTDAKKGAGRLLVSPLRAGQ